jgi:hypothetical protein
VPAKIQCETRNIGYGAHHFRDTTSQAMSQKDQRPIKSLHQGNQSSIHQVLHRMLTFVLVLYRVSSLAKSSPHSANVAEEEPNVFAS